MFAKIDHLSQQVSGLLKGEYHNVSWNAEKKTFSCLEQPTVLSGKSSAESVSIMLHHSVGTGLANKLWL